MDGNTDRITPSMSSFIKSLPKPPAPPMGGFNLPPPNMNHRMQLPGFVPPPMPPNMAPHPSFNVPPPRFMPRYTQPLPIPESGGAIISAGPQLNSPFTQTDSNSPNLNNLPSSVPPRLLASATSTPESSSNSPATSDNSLKEKGTSNWTEHKAPDGRTYFYNAALKQSSWEKPDELKTPAELLLSQCPWKEYKSDSGKIYYHNVNTKESKWSIPKELEDLKDKLKSDLEEDKKDSLEKAMAATLAAIDSPTVDTPDESAAAKMQTQESVAKEKRVTILEFKDKKEAIEAFKDFLKEKGVPGDANWDKAVRIVQNDPRFDVFNKLNEKKQAFNSYKLQRAKDEKEEQRLKQKKAKTDLEEFLINNQRMNSTIKYYKCHEMFKNLDIWSNICEDERRDIYEDVIFRLAKKEKDTNKAMRKRNMKVLSEILDSMTEITFKTTWSEAQQMLIDNPTFAEDTDLLSMDKEDALIVFAEHIKQLELEEEEEREKEKKRVKRQQRKCRDNFISLLDELHEQGKLTSMSLWVELYPVISVDIRFNTMLGQLGSNPLDLFKFYVADLKARFQDEKKIIKEILKEKSFEVQIPTTFREFATVVCDDMRSATLDAGNVKLTYNALIEKAEGREKERQKEESKKMKKLEQNFRALLKSKNVNERSNWESMRHELKDDSAFTAITVEAERIRLYKEYQDYLEETCSHHHSKPKKRKKDRKRRDRSSSGSVSSESEPHGGRRHKSPSLSDAVNSLSESDKRKSKKKKSKKSKNRTSSLSLSSDFASPSPHKSRRSKKKKRKLSPKDEKSSKHDTDDDEVLSEIELERRRNELMKELENIH